MKARLNSILAGVAGLMALALFAGPAGAGSMPGNCNCQPKPPCCQPPSPPPPPVTPCCHQVNVPGVNVVVSPTVIVNASASATVNAGAAAGGIVFAGGGGSSMVMGPGTPGLIQGLNVGGSSRSAYEASRTKITKVVIQAVCIDDKAVPHPASQVFPDREVEDSYEGEIFRCIAGTHMQWTVAEFLGKIDFGNGKTHDCAKGEALYHSPGGKVECKPQKPARDCNERSLLRRFGAGVKVLTMITTETYTAYREETTSTASAMSLDGGVGGVVY